MVDNVKKYKFIKLSIIIEQNSLKMMDKTTP